MIRGMTTVTNSFNVLSEKQKNLAANAANTLTPGYKSQQLVSSTTPQVAIHNYTEGIEANKRREVGELVFSNQLDEAVRDFSSGGLQLTENKTDLAINGDAFFTVENQAGERFYTKNGNFRIDEQGGLVTQEGYQVLGIQPDGAITPITVGTDMEQSFTVDAYGFVHTGTNAPQFLFLSQVDDQAALTSNGGSLFQGGNGVPVGDGFTIEQGYTESSNVDMVDVMTSMLQLSREFEANQKVLQSVNDTLTRATQEVGRT